MKKINRVKAAFFFLVYNALLLQKSIYSLWELGIKFYLKNIPEIFRPT